MRVTITVEHSDGDTAMVSREFEDQDVAVIAGRIDDAVLEVFSD